MGQYIVTVPDFLDAELMFDAQENVRVYDRVRDQIATNLRTRFDEALGGTLAQRPRRPFVVQFVAGTRTSVIWG